MNFLRCAWGLSGPRDEPDLCPGQSKCSDPSAQLQESGYHTGSDSMRRLAIAASQTPLAAEVSLGSWPCQNAGALQIRRTIFLSTPKCPRERWQGGPEFAGAARTRFPSVNATVRVFTRPGSTTDQNESHNKGRRRSPLTSRSAVIGMRAKASWPPLNALSWACLRAPSFDVALARLVVVRIRGPYSWSAQILVGVVSV
jgi:hypothetical protein